LQPFARVQHYVLRGVDKKENCRNNCQNSVVLGKNGYTNENHKQKTLWRAVNSA